MQLEHNQRDLSMKTSLTMFSRRNSGSCSSIIIIDDEPKESSTIPIIVIDDDESYIKTSLSDQNSEMGDLYTNFRGKFNLNVPTRKRLMSLLTQGYHLNEARTLALMSAAEPERKFEETGLHESVPNAPKWPIPGILPCKSENTPNTNIISNFSNEDFLQRAGEVQSFGAYLENESFYNSFKDNIQNLNGRAATPLCPIERTHNIKKGRKRNRTAVQDHIEPASKRSKMSRRMFYKNKRRAFFRSKKSGGKKYQNCVDANLEGLEMGVVPVNLNDNFTKDQFKALQEAILVKILTNKSNDVKPSFLRSYINTHALVISCCDERTVQWLRHAVYEIRQWDGFDLQVVDRSQFPRRNYLIGHFPNCHDISPMNILNFIDAQNYGFNIAEWNIVHKIDQRRNVSEVKFSIDDNSLASLREMDWKIHFQLKRVKLTLVASRKIKVPQQEIDTSFAGTIKNSVD